MRRTTAAGEDWALSWGVIYEFIRVSTHPRVMRPALSLAEALAFLRPFLALQNVTVLGPTPRHCEMLERTAAEHPRVAGNLVFDLRTAVLLREHGLGVGVIEQQAMLVDAEPDIFRAVPGGWGKQGYTNLRLAKADAATLKSALAMAHANVAPQGKAKPRAKANARVRKEP